MPFRQLAALLLLSALWGGSFIFMRVAAGPMGPVAMIGSRMAIAALALLAVAGLTRTLIAPWPHARHFLVLAFFNAVLPFTLIGAAELVLPGSLAVILNATTPLATALVGAVWRRERLHGRQLAGFAAGMAGVASLVGLGPVPLTRETLLAVGATQLAALCYGFSTNYVRTQVHGVPALGLTTWATVAAALMMAPALPVTWPTTPPSPVVWGCVAALALGSTALAHSLYYWLVQAAGPIRTSLVNYMAPAFGILWGWLFLAEPLALGMLVGLGLVLVSVALIVTAPGKG